MGWTTLQNKDVNLYEFLKENTGPDKMIVIGTDSQRPKRRRGRRRKDKAKVTFCTIVAVVESGNSREATRKAIRKVVRTEAFPSLYERLWHEVWLSVDLGMELKETFEESVSDIIIHIDVNEDPKWKSSKYKPALTGFAAGSGFKYEIKPEAWCASAVADAQVRDK